jgi:hypothetical protein
MTESVAILGTLAITLLNSQGMTVDRRVFMNAKWSLTQRIFLCDVNCFVLIACDGGVEFNTVFLLSTPVK